MHALTKQPFLFDNPGHVSEEQSFANRVKH